MASAVVFRGGASIPADVAPMLVPLAVYAAGDALEHPTRQRIRAHLLALPGDHLRSIARSLGIPLGTAIHHIRVLLRSGIIRRESSEGRSRFYLNGGVAPRDMNELYQRYWRYRDLRLRVLFAVRRLPGAGPAKLAKELHISRQLAAYHLGGLVELGLVHRAGNGYVAAPEVKEPSRLRRTR